MSILNHLAIIMDGNNRWAKARNLSALEGHKAGAEKIWQIVNHVIHCNIKHLSLFAFSSENWSRPYMEVQNLLWLIEYYLDKEVMRLHQFKIRLQIIGDITVLKPKLREKIMQVSKDTSLYSNLTLYIAFNYGSKQEIIQAVKKIISEQLSLDSITEESFSKLFYAPTMPDIDLMIRTSNQQRLSNFLLWQCAYAELYFEQKLWPDYTEQDLDQAIAEFYRRQRNFGKRANVVNQ